VGRALPQVGELNVDEFVVKSSVNDARFEFFDRLPVNPVSPIESFGVKLSRYDLRAVTKVWASYTGAHPAQWFCELAGKWHGWQAELQWESLEQEVRLAATHDRFGHIAIRIELRSGLWIDDWSVAATVTVDAGQLEGLARHAISFFGEDGTYK